ncbi:MAG: hypothetical protein NTZ90_02400 [Proteobacteria bacterium]|nr:hypothetical protein [Pseudomonadota bacterium]
MMRTHFFVLVLGLSTFACNGDADRYEDIQKLRALGVLSDKAVVEPSTTATPQVVTLTFYAALPHGDTVTAEPYQDTATSSGGTPATLTVNAGTAVVETHASFDLYHVSGTLNIPPVDALVFRGLDQNATVKYGIKLTTKSSGSQNIVGSVVVYQSGAAQLKSLAAIPTVKITAPAKSAALSGKQDIVAAASTTGAETLRLGWFVNGGEIKNRNAAATTWDPIKTTGAVTLVVTARGAKTGAFALDVIDFTAN